MFKVALAGMVASAALASPAWAGWHEDAAQVRDGLARAVAGGRISADNAQTYREIVARAAAVRRTLPWDRAEALSAVMHDVAAQWEAYKPPRAYALFTMLDFNASYLAHNPLPAVGTDVHDEDGVTYRAVAGQGLQFHPLANFSHLSALIAAQRPADAEILAAALMDRAVVSGQGAVWEYYFPYGSGAPWTSGMVQAVAARALAAAGDPADARLAFAALPPLLHELSAGPWVRLYSYSNEVVLNAQLQAIYSLFGYGEVAQYEPATAEAERMLAAANALFDRFDTGAWSLYSLGGPEAPLGYHRYVILLLRKLYAITGDEIWQQRAERFDGYRTTPPVVRMTVRAKRIRVWVSKLSTVSLRVGAWSTSFTLPRGSTSVRVPAHGWAVLTATDVCGNKTVVRRRIALKP